MRHLALLLLLAGSARGGDDPAEALLREIDAIVAERREGGRGADADALAAEVADLRRRLAENGAPGPSAVPDTHVVYVRDVPERKVDVRVTVRSRPVVLVLGSQEAVTWHVDAQGADLSRIVTFWGRDRLVIAEPRVP
ncbi:MAG TPA: hypothetical protein VFY93_10090, partial [Planctomycetota bacterium]|nr:hypothetical protein [Planctomycetota bacterium]